MTVRPSDHLSGCTGKGDDSERRENKGKPPGTSEGCTSVDVTLPDLPLPSLSGRSITLCLVVVNEAILNTVMKKN